MELFKRERTTDYLDNKKRNLKIEIENLSDSQIINTNIDDLRSYYIDKYTIDTIHIYMDKMSQDIEQSKLEQYNPFYGMGFRESRTFQVDSCKINYSIPFSGNYELLYLQPTMSILSSFEIDGFNNLNNTKYLPSIKLSLNLSLQDLQKSDNPQKFIETKFNNLFNSYNSMISYVNNDISSYNSNLDKYITNLLNIRKNKADSFSNLMEKINIPLKRNPNAPNTTPIPIIAKKEVRTFPEQRKPEKNWCISDNDYSNIKNIISQACISFEHSPSACQKLNEEELRDMLLSNLNTHYNASATGETFSKNGKTDIRIQFDNKSAYIAECKIWHGISQFRNAIMQLFSYTTWRDIKTSLIIFNKEVKDFSSILCKIKSELNENPLKISISEISKNEWQCTFKKDLNSQELVELHIIICDISI